MNIEDKMKAYLDEKGSEVFTSYTDQGNASFDVYRETTADGYEVFVAKHTEDRDISIGDHVYYYEHDLEDVILEKIDEGNSLYVDQDLFDELYIEELLADLYDEWQEELNAVEDTV
tara:strand:- start:2340 stop:2687 length:348 start_codon:yes stop_codon:yes gene_type:complete